ncbi:MAG: DUF418 domain-containing protein, partial [Planctomycetota bacterium]
MSNRPSQRHRFLDVLRGFALLGILPVNIPYFALAVTDAEGGGAIRSLWDRIVAEGTDALFTYRFLSIFSLLFGVGIVILRRRCEARGAPFGRVIVRRLLALLLFGALHVLLLWYGDILVLYAIAGLVLFVCSAWRASTLQATGVVLVVVPILLVLALAAVPGLAELIDTADPDLSEEAVQKMAAASSGPIDDFVGALPEFHPAFESAVYRDGTFARQIALRLVTWLGAMIFAFLVISPRVAGLFLIGMAFAKSGWILRPAENRGRSVALAGWGLGAGIPLQVLATWVAFGEDAPARAELVREAILQGASLCTMAGYIGLLGLACARPSPRRWTAPLEAIGRTAFSNYILQSILCTALFYSWGFGLFGSFSRAPLLGVVIGVWALQLSISPLWLRRHRSGPLEMIWRRMTYGRGRREISTSFSAPAQTSPSV